MGKPYETIVAWQKADDLVVETYRVTQGFPKAELYGLTSQIRRVAVSAAANIVEGSARQYLKEYQQFLHMADSSLSEVAYYVHLAYRLELIGNAARDRLEGMRSDVGRPLHGLIAWIGDQIQKGATLNKRVSDESMPYNTGCQPSPGDR